MADRRRRRVVLAGAAMGVGLAAPALILPRLVFAAPNLVLTPEQSPGPFYPRIRPRDASASLLRGPIAGGARPLDVMGRVKGRNGRPLAGLVVELWQTDAAGHYLEDVGADRLQRGFTGYGRVMTGGNGGYAFKTIHPGVYPGRTPHLHFALSGPGFGPFTTQMYFKDHPGNREDFLLRFIRGDARRRSVIIETEKGQRADVARFDMALDL